MKNTQDSSATDFFSELDPDHAQLLRDSAISPDVAARRGYATVTVKAELRWLGFSDRQCRTPCLLIPIRDMSGNIVNYQIRPNSPYIQKQLGKGDKAIKYETVSDNGLCLDIPNDPEVRKSLRADGPPLFITEGARKVDSGVSHGILTIGVLGVYGWRGRNEIGGITTLPDWENIHLKGRLVYLTFDSDARENRQVRTALKRLKRFLESKGAKVKVIWLPPASDGSKVGLDDFFAAGNSVQDLIQHASDEIPNDDERNTSHPYKTSDNGLEWLKETHQGSEIIPLTNFNARIITEAVEDDGTSTTQRIFTIESEMNGNTRRFDVSASRFATMQWAIEYIGVGAVVWPGRIDHARCAIQCLSEEINHITVYKHTGWREVDGEFIYLHSGGAVGKTGLVSNIIVKLGTELSRFCLLDPPTDDRLREAIRASIGMIKVSSALITYPVFAATYRAILGQCDFGIHLTGESGAGKSEIAALAQMHYGIEMTAKKLPASWISTDNVLEVLGFTTKDALIVIDDFIPTGSPTEVQREQRKADRIFRGLGNQAGRQRLWADGNMRDTKWVRGLVLSTGEDTPKGQSLRARFLTLEVDKKQGPNIVIWDELTKSQAAAAEGLYTEAMAGFIKWIAPQYGEIRRNLKREISQLRQKAATSGAHKRTPEIVANLALGLRWFLKFAVASGAITPTEAKGMFVEGWAAFGEAAAAQKHHQAANDPAEMFKTSLTAALASGAAHIAMVNGSAPQSLYDDDEPTVSASGNPLVATSWGWRETFNEPSPQGSRIGWISDDGQNLYLEPKAAFAVAQQLANKSNENLSINSTTLWKRLRERGYLLNTDTKRRTMTIRRTIQGRNQDVLHIAFDFLGAGIESQNADNADEQNLNASEVGINDVDFDVGVSSNADNDADEQTGQSRQNVSITVSSPENADNEKGNNENNLQSDVGNVGFCEDIEPTAENDSNASGSDTSLPQSTDSDKAERREVRTL